MRPLSPSLLAAQRTPGGVACVQVRLEDRELRWRPLLDQSTSTRQTAACATGAAILRARISAAGTLDVQRLTAPDEASQWQSWTVLTSGVAPESDVAVSAADADPERLRLFFVRSGGAPFRLSYVQSGDGGLTWTAPADLTTALAAPGQALASANAQLFYHDPADAQLKLAIRSGWDTGGWTVATWVAAGSLATRYGLAAGYAAGVYHLVACDQESPEVQRLRTGTYVPGTGLWTDPVAVVPPGLPAAAFIPRYPSLVRAGGLWHLAYLETVSGVLAYAEPTVIHSPDWEHWSYAAWVPLQGFGEVRRAVLVACQGVFYLALEEAVWRAGDYDPADADRHLVSDQVASYVVEEEPGRGSALVELPNPGGLYRGFGQEGQAGAPVRPLARLVIERGFQTAAGAERAERTPYYVVNAAVRRGGRSVLAIEAEDGWGLLQRWRPDALYVWSGKTVAWLIAEVLYRAAGLGCSFDGASGWDTVLDRFAIAPRDWDEPGPPARRAWTGRSQRTREPQVTSSASGLSAVRTLLAKVSGAAHWQADGSLRCFVPAAQVLADPYVIGAGGEILDGLYGRGLVIPTQARVYGDGASSVAAAADALGSPRRYLATYVDPHLDTAGECADRARGLVHDGQVRARLGWVETPCQCGLELYDVVVVDDPQGIFAPAEWLRVVGIVERYDPAEGVFVTRATLEGA